MSAARLKVATILCLALLTCLAGCKRTPALYAWGSYEDQIYDMYINPGKAEPGIQIDRLTEDIERAELEGKRTPPGVHAHLGYLYYTQGNVQAALAEFSTEKALFPESAAFIDGMVARLKKNRKKR